MLPKQVLLKIVAELSQGIKLPKCRKCGCMQETLAFLQAADLPPDFQEEMVAYLSGMEAISYPCLGCEYCYPAVVANLFQQGFPGQASGLVSSCGWEVRETTWPPVPGEYFAFCEGSPCPVAVSTLAGPALAEDLARVKPPGLCLVGKTETENIGLDKIIKNTISNPTIKYLLLSGPESQGHFSGRTLLCLKEKGVDQEMRVIGSPGQRPVLANVTASEVEAFRRQVEVIDMIGCEDLQRLVEKIGTLSQALPQTCDCQGCGDISPVLHLSPVPIIKAAAPIAKKLDKAGYFVILPLPEKRRIRVEHYSYDNKLLRVVEGEEARSLYGTIIAGGWVTELSHAAYLGRELTRAQLALETGSRYVQDGA